MRTGTAVSCGVVYCNVPFIAGILILNFNVIQEIDCNLKKWTNVQLTAFCFNFSIKHEPEATALSCLVLAIALNIFPSVQYE